MTIPSTDKVQVAIIAAAMEIANPAIDSGSSSVERLSRFLATYKAIASFVHSGEQIGWYTVNVEAILEEAKKYLESTQ